MGVTSWDEPVVVFVVEAEGSGVCDGEADVTGTKELESGRREI